MELYPISFAVHGKALSSEEKLDRGNPEAEHSQDVCLHIPLSSSLCVETCREKMEALLPYDNSPFSPHFLTSVYC